MSDILLKSMVGSGGFLVKFASANINLGAGATGTIITLTPPAGQKVRLTGLMTNAGTDPISLTTINIGGVAVVTAVKLAKNTAGPEIANGFRIGYNQPNQHFLEGDIDEVIDIITDIGTSQIIGYSYQFGI